MVQTVRMPDGTIARFPDEATPKQIAAALGATSDPATPISSLPNISGLETPGLLQQGLIGLGRGFTDVSEGVQQLGATINEAVGLSPEGSVERLTQAAQADRDFFAQTPVGQSLTGRGARFAGNVLPFAAVPASAGGLLGRIGTEALIGGGLGATQFVPEGGSRLANVGIGAATGGAVPALTTGARAAIPRLRGLTTTPEQQAVIAAGQRANVPVFGADIGSPAAARAATLLERVPGGTTRPRLQQGAAAQRAAQDLTDEALDTLQRTEFGGAQGLQRLQDVASQPGPRQDLARRTLESIAGASDDDIGTLIQASAGTRQLRATLISDRMFQRAEDAAQDLPSFQPGKALAELEKRLSALKASVVPDTKAIATLTNAAERLQTPQTYVSARAAVSDLLSTVRDMNKTGGIGSRGTAALTGVAGALDDDIDDLVRVNGNTNVQKLHRRARAFFARNLVPFKDGKGMARALSSETPDEIFGQFVKRGKGDRAFNFYRNLDDKGKAAVRYGIISGALETSISDRGIFSPAKFSSAIEKMDAPIRKIFSGSARTELEGFRKLMRFTERAGQIRENPPTGNRLTELLIGGGLGAGVIAAPVETAAAVGGVLTLTAGLRGLLTTNAGRALMLAAGRTRSPSRLAGMVNQAEGLLARTLAAGAIETSSPETQP